MFMLLRRHTGEKERALSALAATPPGPGRCFSRLVRFHAGDEGRPGASANASQYELYTYILINYTKSSLTRKLWKNNFERFGTEFSRKGGNRPEKIAFPLAIFIKIYNQYIS